MTPHKNAEVLLPFKLFFFGSPILGKNDWELGINRYTPLGVPFVAQWLMNPTRIHEVVGSIPSLVQWVKYPVVP